MNSETEALTLVTRERRTHQKDIRKSHDEEARASRIRRKKMLESVDDDEDWRDYVNR